MKNSLILLCILLCGKVSGQSAIDWYNKGNDKLSSQDYAGSIKDYDRALMMDANFTDAYYNRGTSKLYLKNYTGAIDDFTKAINLKPDFINAYNNRANAKISLQDIKGAMQDYDAIIKIDPAYATAWLVRGQLKYNTGDETGGCADLHKAKSLGDTRADNIIQKFCTTFSGTESLILNWPAPEKWKVANYQPGDEQQLTEWTRENETLKNWTEFGSLLAMKNITVPVEKSMNMIFEQAKDKTTGAKLTLLEKDEKAEYPWILFTIEGGRSKTGNDVESQVWYIVQGKQSLYIACRSVKTPVIAPDHKEKCRKFFKSSQVKTE